MAQDLKVTCPKCGYSVDLSKAVQDELFRGWEAEARKKMDKEKEKALSDLQEQLDEKEDQIKEFRKNETDLRKKQRELEAKAENIELEITRQVDQERKQIAQEAREKADEESKNKIKEYEKKLSDLRDELESAKRKADQGSQQLQGEIAELDLEEVLKRSFPYDEIVPVGKGIRGADIHQRVQTPNGQYCGLIIWESKNTRNWSDRWLVKIKEDQLSSKADIAVIISSVLPDDVHHFSCLDGTWVAGFPYVIGLATALRETLVGVAKAHRSSQGKDEKIEELFHYFSGPEFKQRIEMIVTTFSNMKSELDSEKRAMIKLWSQREKSIEKVTGNIAGMYGDLQGIIGAALPTIRTLELPEPVDLDE